MGKTSDKQPAIKESKSDEISLVLKWATFCKSIATEPDSQEITLIGILPGMEVQIGTMPGQEEQIFHVPIPLWVYAQFQVTPAAKTLTTCQVDFIIGFGDKPQTIAIALNINEGQPIASANIRIYSPTGLPVKAGSQTLSGKFMHNGKELGKVELPILVKVVT